MERAYLINFTSFHNFIIPYQNNYSYFMNVNMIESLNERSVVFTKMNKFYVFSIQEIYKL